MARPTKYNPQIEEQICKALQSGSTRTAAVAAAGIDYVTFLAWLQRFSSFSSAIARAEAKSEIACTDVLFNAATRDNGDWRAALEWLKRRRREEWTETVPPPPPVEPNLNQLMAQLFPTE